MQQILIRVKPKEARLDKYLAQVSKQVSRSQAKKLIKSGFIQVNERSVEPDYELNRGDKIKIEIPPPKPVQVLPENISLNIVYEDQFIIVLDKDSGMVVHPTLDHPKGTLANALLFYLKKQTLPETGENLRPGIVHRLDKGTSGLIVVAKDQEALGNLKNQFKERKVIKKYTALVTGKIEPPKGEINKPIERHPKNRRKFVVAKSGKEAITYYSKKEDIDGLFSLIEVEPKTGRTHQIRVHLASIGYPIVGDKLYGGKMAPRIFLHASYIEFSHPYTKKTISFTSSLPKKLNEILEKSKNTKKI